MPNWCENEVVISGKPEDMKKFKEDAIIDGKFCFNNLIPRPSELDIMSGGYGSLERNKQKQLEKKQAENIKKYGAKDWYDWNCENWGTKWDIEWFEVLEEQYSDTEILLRLVFETAWSPGTGIYNYIVNNYSNLNVSWYYHEPGNQIAGYLPD